VKINTCRKGAKKGKSKMIDTSKPEFLCVLRVFAADVAVVLSFKIP
jgi:hypothetical protein